MTSKGKLISGVSQGVVSFSYDQANRLWAMGSTTYINDAIGSRTSKQDSSNYWDYTYDGESRLTKVAKNSVTQVENTYDGNGMRVKKVENGKTTYYIYSGANPLIEYSLNDGSFIYRIYAGKNAIAEEKNGVVKFYHKDHLGSTRVVTDASGTKVAEYKYAPYGEKELSSGDGTDYGFTDKAEDASTGLQYFGARFYDSEVGRFITQDPAKDGMNWFIYCDDNPITRIDSNGLYWGAVHGQMTRAAAAALGITDAKAITQMVSANVKTDYQDARNKEGYDWARHFDNPLTKGDDRDKFAKEELQKAVEAWNNGNKAEAYQHLGDGLHSVQDKGSHKGVGGWNVSHTLARDWLKFDVDDPKNDQKAADKAVKDSIDYLENFLEAITEDSDTTDTDIDTDTNDDE